MKTNLSKVDKERQVFLMLSLRKNDSRLRWKKIVRYKIIIFAGKKILHSSVSNFENLAF